MRFKIAVDIVGVIVRKDVLHLRYSGIDKVAVRFDDLVFRVGKFDEHIDVFGRQLTECLSFLIRQVLHIFAVLEDEAEFIDIDFALVEIHDIRVGFCAHQVAGRVRLVDCLLTDLLIGLFGRNIEVESVGQVVDCLVAARPSQRTLEQTGCIIIGQGDLSNLRIVLVAPDL